MKVAEGIDTVEGLRVGNAYLVRVAERLLVVDSGTPGSAKRILASIERIGARPSDLRRAASRGGTPQRETIVATNQTSTTPEGGATADMAKRKGGASTRNAPPAGGGAVYGLGMIGALAYFLGSAESRRDYVLALGKATVWPALLVYRAFKILGG